MKLLVIFVVACVAMASTVVGLSSNFKEVGHYGTFYGYRKTYYFNQVDRVSGSEHRQSCLNAGLQPLRIENSMEQNYFIAMVRGNSEILQDTWIHTGAFYSGLDWVWDNHERISHAIAWAIHQPDGEGTERCLTVAHWKPESENWNHKGVGFNDWNCSDLSAFFCQKVGG